MKPPVFSVIIPVYNAAETIRATVDSVLGQTEGDFELLLIDDGSTDDSLEHMLELAGRDRRIKVLSQANKGVAATRNLGVELSWGSLIAFLDADDLWAPDKLARHRALHEKNPWIGLSFARTAFLEQTDTALESARAMSSVPCGALKLAELIAENPVCTTSNIVVSRACFDGIGGFREDIRHAEDQEWLLRVADAGFWMIGLDEVLVGYRMSAGGLSAELGQMHRNWLAIAGAYRERVDIGAAEAVYCRYLARRALRTGAGICETARYILLGLRRDARAFFADRRRGAMTLAGALSSVVLPVSLQRKFFA